MSTEPYGSTANPIIVGGTARSGTTLLSVILNSHPELVCGPESDLFRRWPELETLSEGWPTWIGQVFRGRTGFAGSLARNFGIPLRRMRFLWRSSSSPAEFIDRFFGEYARRQGVRRWAEKTPANIKCLGFIFRHFPHAKFVQIIRDGRDALCSMLDWSSQYSTQHHPPLNIRSAAITWNEWVRLGRQWMSHPNYTEIRYENLVADPERTLRALFEFLELEWEPQVLAYSTMAHANRPDLYLPHLAGVWQPVYRTSVGRWRQDLNPEDRRIVEEIAGALLRELGYTDSAEWVQEPAGQLITTS